MKIKIEPMGKLKFTEKEKAFLQALETDVFFEKFVLKVRKLFPEHIGKHPEYQTNRPQWIFIAANILAKAYKDLPDYWVEIFGGFIRIGIAYPSISKKWNTIRYEYNEESNEAGFGQPKKIVQITIESKTSIKQLKKYLETARGLKEALEKLPEGPNIKADIELFKKIIQLSNQYKGKKIEEEINKIWKIGDYSAISKYKSRGKKYIGKLLQKNEKYLEEAFDNLNFVKKLAKKIDYYLPEDL